MPRVVIVAFLLLISIFAAAQTSTQPSSQGAQPSGRAQMHMEHQQRMAGCQQMMQQHMAEMRTTSQALNSNLAQMKSTLPMISDVNERSRWQSNIAMWQAVVDHFNHMADHMQHMQAMGLGCGPLRGYHTMPGMGDGEPKPVSPSK